MSYTENYQKWLDFAELPAYLRDELVSMDEKTKEDAFYTNLEFGTAGMRGLIGAGTNRINIYDCSSSNRRFGAIDRLKR